jgi:hypothetical protein
MSAQKMLEIENSYSSIFSGDQADQRINGNFVRESDLKNLKKAIKFSLSVVYFLGVVYFLVRLLA